jgi:hypothetical protein
MNENAKIMNENAKIMNEKAEMNKKIVILEKEVMNKPNVYVMFLLSHFFSIINFIYKIDYSVKRTKELSLHHNTQ